MSAIARMNPDRLFDPSGSHYSHVSTVTSGPLAFVSGQVAWADGKPAPSGLREQAHIVVGHLGTCLEALSATPSDIVMLRIYVVDLTPERTVEVMEPLGAFLGDSFPSLTGIGVAALAGPELQLEVEMVVRVPA
ncbi:MAG: RidA family protein [Myxococcota bacterium]